MRALLVNPWITDFAAYNLWSEPIGLLAIGAYLQSLGWQVSLMDCLDRRHPDLRGCKIREDSQGRGHYLKTLVPKPAAVRHVPRRFGRYGLPLQTVLRELAATPAPDLVLVTSGMTYWYPGVQHAIAVARERFPHAPVVLGGVYATLSTEHAREYSGADHILPGDWTHSLPRLLRDLGLIPSSTPEPVSAPAPAHALRRNQGFAAVATSRGCPLACTYCATRLLYPQGYQARPVEDVIAEIADCVENLRIPDIAFFDDALLAGKGKTFAQNASEGVNGCGANASPLRFEQLLDELIARGVRCRFHTPNGLHTRGITDALARKMKRAGFATIRLSLETVSETTLRATGAKTSADDFARAVDCLKRAGFEGVDIGAYVLAGLAGQTAQEVMDTIAFVHAQGVSAHLSRFAPIPGTVEWERWARAGLIARDADPLLHNHVLPFPPGAPLTEDEFQAAVMAARRGNQYISHVISEKNSAKADSRSQSSVPSSQS